MKETGLAGFDQFWAVYPRKVAKKEALRAWVKLRPTKEQLERMLKALVWQKRQEGWIQDGGMFIPHASTYLNGERWEDVEDVDLADVVAGKMWWETSMGIEAKGKELGLEPRQFSCWPEFKNEVMRRVKVNPIKSAA